MSKVPSTKSTPSSATVRRSPSTASNGKVSPGQEPAPVSKPKRVRTGCLTCRERHLKCDEGTPNCQNCTKSNRRCKRGIRLNFHDVVCERPAVLLPRASGWAVTFQDDSREIASEYKGGLERYHPLEPEPKRQKIEQMGDVNYDYGQIAAPVMAHQQLPAQQAPYSTYGDHAQSIYPTATTQAYGDHMQQMQAFADQTQSTPQGYEQTPMIPQEPPAAPGPPLSDADELFYMQVFIEEVGIWMDSMDAAKHFSRLVPFQALREPMLKHAMLACAVRHLTLINSSYSDGDALQYYNSATQFLLKSLQNPDRDSTLCATAATILNVYEVMNEKALQRMNHIAGARALIKECRWDGTATGIGGACFWLNVGLEIFSCLHFNWQVAWDPDTWGIDMNMTPSSVGGNEEEWNHKILWIVAKCVNFSATFPHFQEPNIHAEQLRLQTRQNEWLGLKQFCDRWDHCVPPTMRPVAYLSPGTSRSKSAFPNLWFIKRTTVMARLFYHTAMALLGNHHPMAAMDQATATAMQEMKLHHARQICGIVRHGKDRGVATGAIRCLAVAGEFLTEHHEQEECLTIFESIKKETGWRVTFINDDLKEKWGWNKQYDSMANSGFNFQGQVPTMPPVQPRQKPPSGIVNPMYKNADFKGQNPPYQGSYVPLASGHGHVLHSTQVYGFNGLTTI